MAAATRLIVGAGAGAAGGLAINRYGDQLNAGKFGEAVLWACGQLGKSAPVVQGAPAPAPVIHVSTTSGSGPSWRVITAIGSGAVAGVIYAYQRGLTLQDLAWVTQNVFDVAVGELQLAVGETQTAVGQCRRDLGLQVDQVDQRVIETRDHLERTIAEEVGQTREELAGVHAQLRAQLDELHDEVATKDQLAELQALVEGMRGTGEDTHGELQQLHAEIRALATFLLQRGGDAQELRRLLAGSALPHELAVEGRPHLQGLLRAYEKDTTRDSRPFTPPDEPAAAAMLAQGGHDPRLSQRLAGQPREELAASVDCVANELAVSPLGSRPRPGIAGGARIYG